MGCNCGGGRKFTGSVKTMRSSNPAPVVDKQTRTIQSANIRSGSLTGSVPLKRTTV